MTQNKEVIEMSISDLEYGAFTFRLDLGDLTKLTEDIREHKILNPLLVSPSVKAQGKFSVVDGNTRLRVAQTLGYKTVPTVNVGSLSYNEQWRAAITTNILRKALSPKDTANAVKQYQQIPGNEGKSHSVIATELGLNCRDVDKYLCLIELSPEIQDKIANKDTRSEDAHRAGKVPLHTAELLARATTNKYKDDITAKYKAQEEILAKTATLPIRMKEAVIRNIAKDQKNSSVDEIISQTIEEEQITASVALSHELHEAVTRYKKDYNLTPSKALRSLILEGLKYYGYMKK